MIFSLLGLEQAQAETPFKIKAKYGKIWGKGEGDNEFSMTPGVILALSNMNKKNGASWSVGYQKLENKVGDSKAEGALYTLSQFDFYFSLFKIPNLYWSIGIGWDMMGFDDTSKYDHMYTLPVGLVYRLKVWKRYMDISATGRYIWDNSLEQDMGFDVALSLPFK